MSATDLLLRDMPDRHDAEVAELRTLLSELYEATSAIHQEYDSWNDGPAQRAASDDAWGKLYDVRKKVAEMLAKEEM